MEKQELRNALSSIEDEARRRRHMARQANSPDAAHAFELVVNLTKLVREEIVR